MIGRVRRLCRRIRRRRLRAILRGPSLTDLPLGKRLLAVGIASQFAGDRRDNPEPSVGRIDWERNRLLQWFRQAERRR